MKQSTRVGGKPISVETQCCASNQTYK